MVAGIPWSWDSYRSYLDAVDALPKAINYAVQNGFARFTDFNAAWGFMSRVALIAGARAASTVTSLISKQ